MRSLQSTVPPIISGVLFLYYDLEWLSQYFLHGSFVPGSSRGRVIATGGFVLLFSPCLSVSLLLLAESR